MKIHEYQAKQILAKYGVPVPRGSVAATVEEAVNIAKELGGRVVVNKPMCSVQRPDYSSGRNSREISSTWTLHVDRKPGAFR